MQTEIGYLEDVINPTLLRECSAEQFIYRETNVVAKALINQLENLSPNSRNLTLEGLMSIADRMEEDVNQLVATKEFDLAVKKYSESLPSSKMVFTNLMYYIYNINELRSRSMDCLIQTYTTMLITYMVFILSIFTEPSDSYVAEFFEELKRTLREKNHDYTNDSKEDALINFKRTMVIGLEPEYGVLVRLIDKVGRIETFVSKGELKVRGEGFMDAIKDSIGYLIILSGLLESKV